MAEDLSVVKKTPKADGSEKSFSSDEWFRSEETLGSKDSHSSKESVGSKDSSFSSDGWFHSGEWHGSKDLSFSSDGWFHSEEWHGSNDSHSSKESHGSKELFSSSDGWFRSEEVHGSVESLGSEEAHGSVESLGSKEAHGGSLESLGSKVAHGSVEADDGSNDLSAKPVEEYTVIGKPVDGDPHRPYREYDWQGVFQMGDIKVCQLGRKKKKFDKIYGKIKLHYSNGEWNLYNRKKEDAETIDVPGFITVTPPLYGISPYDHLKISFDMEGGLKGMNEKVVYWSAGWDFCDRVYYYRVRRRGCSIKLSYMGFSTAVLADMKIELLHMCHQEEIYGTITASFSKVPDLPPLFMFNKKLVGCVCVKEKEPVPLSRPFIAYPKGSELKINVDLQTISGTPVAQGAIKIIPQTLGRWVGVLEKRGEIQVRATVLFFPFDDRN